SAGRYHCCNEDKYGIIFWDNHTGRAEYVIGMEAGTELVKAHLSKYNKLTKILRRVLISEGEIPIGIINLQQLIKLFHFNPKEG
nr:hypothetical protein [Tanacetum cinerariifolium]